MKEQLITFETAKLAKEMGFQLYTSFYYSEGMEIKGTKMGMHGNPNAYGEYQHQLNHYYKNG